MKKKYLIVTLTLTVSAYSSTAFGGMDQWLLYLPAILSASPAAPPVITTPSSQLLLFLPPILAAGKKTPIVVVTDPTLNDTGITACTGSTGEEDCNYGRDVTVPDPSPTDGYMGFSFTKLDSSGTALSDQTVDYATTQWSCVKDNTTGLTWEVKTTGNKSTTYSWYNSDPATNGGSAGYVNDGVLNTEAYVAAINAAGLCGAGDWRMPTIKELLSLVSLNTTANTIDTDYFPNNSGIYWSGTPADRYGDEVAWGVSFLNGYADRTLYKSEGNAYHVRLVRSDATQ